MNAQPNPLNAATRLPVRGVRRARLRRCFGEKEQAPAGSQHEHEDDVAPSHVLAQQPGREQGDIQGACRLEEDRVGGGCQLVRDDEGEEGHVVADTHQQGATVPVSTRRRDADEKSDGRDARPEAGDLPGIERGGLDGCATRREE